VDRLAAAPLPASEKIMGGIFLSALGDLRESSRQISEGPNGRKERG